MFFVMAGIAALGFSACVASKGWDPQGGPLKMALQVSPSESMWPLWRGLVALVIGLVFVHPLVGVVKCFVE